MKYLFAITMLLTMLTLSTAIKANKLSTSFTFTINNINTGKTSFYKPESSGIVYFENSSWICKKLPVEKENDTYLGSFTCKNNSNYILLVASCSSSKVDKDLTKVIIGSQSENTYLLFISCETTEPTITL